MNILLAFVIVLLLPFMSLAQSGNKSDAINHLRAFTLATSEDTVLGDKTAMLLGLVETNRSVPTKQVSVALTNDIRFFTVSTVSNSDDIILTIVQDGAVRIMYLTNSTLLLRATAVLENRTPHLISNEEAAAGFEALLLFWVEKSKSLQAGHAH
ncbi:hypothetical protein AYO43_01350 [Nitrospira sp. SCGC AG-212-E16]|nr:hypothetical protein AYO43_01350 [Nitrospira sp. SCGC AG-212-E16]